MRVLRRKFWTVVATWKYRHKDPEVCCCGCNMGQGGDICRHGGCRSAKEYAITRFVAKRETL